MKYCDQCGRPLKDGANFCAFCGRECKNSSERMKASNKNHKLPKKSGFKRFIAAVVVISITIICIAAVGFFGNKEKISPVNSADDAIAQLERLGRELGYENALSELTEKSTTTIDGDSYFRLQQNYHGIPVYGRTVVYSVDEKGRSLAITGNVIDVNNDLNMKPTISAEQATKSITTYFTNKLGFDEVGKIDRLGEENLCIYNLGQDDITHLAYKLCIGTYEVILDAQNADIVYIASTVSSMNKSTMGYLASDIYQVNGFAVEVFQNEESKSLYWLNDSGRGISIQNFHGQYSNEIDAAGNKIDHFLDQTASYVISEDIIFGNGEEANWGYEDGVHLLLNLSQILDYASENLGFKTENGMIRAFFNDGYYNGMNALGGTLTDTTGRSGLISMGEKTGTNDIDVISHEFGHIMSFTFVQWNSDALQTKAVNEGLSDIFGEIIEAAINNWEQPDWIMCGENIDVYRNISNPRETGYAEIATDQYTGSDSPEYGYSTIISRTAYLMCNGIDGNDEKKILSDELVRLWYRAMLMMPSDCDFAECRTLVELAGRSMNLSDEQIQCIREAFDAVGIPDEETVDYEMNIDSTLCVYGADSELFTDYTIQIEGKRFTLEKINELGKEDIGFPLDIVKLTNNYLADYSDSIEVSTAEAVRLDLPVGIYTITLHNDTDSGKTYTFKVSIDLTGGLDNLNIYTNFCERKLLRQVNTYHQGELVQTDTFHYNEKQQLTGVHIVYLDYLVYLDTEVDCTYTYDDDGRLVKADRDDFWLYFYNEEYEYNDIGQLISHKIYWGGEGFDDPNSQYDFEYDDNGFQIFKTYSSSTYDLDTGNRYLKKRSESKYTYVFDEQGRVVEKHRQYAWIDSDYRITTSFGSYWATEYDYVTKYTYDSAGQVVSEQQLYVIEDSSAEKESKTYCYDFNPLVSVSYGSSTNLVIMDTVGNPIWWLFAYDSDLVADADGYLSSTSVNKNGYHYEFYYDGDELPQKVEETPTEPQNVGNEPNRAVGELEYPISEEDAYIILKNYFPGFDDEDVTVEISHTGEGDNEMLFFDIKLEFIKGEPPMTWGFFNVYVNTGICTGGAQGHEDLWPEFQAEDYYY